MASMQERIVRAKREKNAVILAHFYQTMDIQEIADHVGDSFELAKHAKEAKEPVIVLCGVRFMAQSAKILNPEKTVLLPVLNAGCPMADMVEPEDVKRLRERYPDAAVMCYVNSSAAVKAQCDICCTSSSAVRIAKSLKEERIIFVPDRNLGAYVASKVPEKEFILFEGLCPIHHRVSVDDVKAAKAAHPDALILAHPECTMEVLALCDFIGSTKEILDYVENSRERKFIIGTEIGVVERLRKTVPDKLVYLLSSGLLCPNMKKTRLENLLFCLENNVYEIDLPEEQRRGAQKSLQRMVAVE